MKKILLMACAGMISLSAFAAQESIDFTMAFKVNEALTFGKAYVGKDIWQSFYFSPELATLYAGGNVTAINITAGENLGNVNGIPANGITRVTTYLMEGLGTDAFRTQNGQLTHEAYGENSIVLDEPYTIEAGKGFYVAYKCTPISENDYYIPVDGVPRMQSGGCFIGVADKGEIYWNDYAEDFGNLNMGITIESDHLPQNGVGMFMADYPEVVHPGEKFDISLSVTGAAVNDASDIEVSVMIADETPVTRQVALPEPLAFGQYTTVELKDIECTAIGANMPMTISITKVNGVANVATEGSRAVPLTCLSADMGYQRRFLVEEGTGTWCQYCPAGIVVMDYLRAEYPDTFVRVAVHGNDEMTVSSTDPVLSMFSVFPTMMVDRSEVFVPGMESLEWLDNYCAEKVGVPAIAEISEIDARVDTGSRKVDVDASVRFAVPAANDGRYGIAYYITEDNVGPYVQTNGYAGYSTPIGGWENEPERVVMLYDDVARDYAGGTNGLNLLPATLEAEKEYSFSQSLSLANVTHDTFYVTVFIIDNADDTVLNVKQISVSDQSGVKSVDDVSSVRVKGDAGKVRIAGEYSKACIYDLSGSKVREVSDTDEVTVNAGIYIVVVDGASFKTIVK